MTPYEKAVRAAMWIEFTAPVKVGEFTFVTMFNTALAALSADGPVIVIDGKVVPFMNSNGKLARWLFAGELAPWAPLAWEQLIDAAREVAGRER